MFASLRFWIGGEFVGLKKENNYSWVLETHFKDLFVCYRTIKLSKAASVGSVLINEIR